jgi:quercetin dioxygenase-like cupin family protein
MQKQTLISKPLLYKANGSANSLFFTFDLPTLIANMKQTRAWERGELNAMILLKSPEKQIVLTALHGGTEISSFQSNDSITFQIIEGKLDFHSKKESVTIDTGQMLTLHENIKYRLTSREETVFLLTTANSNLQPSEN